MAKSKFVTIETPTGNIKWDTGLQWKARAKKLATKYGDNPEVLNAILGIETVGVVNMVTATLTRNQLEGDSQVIQFKKPVQKRKAAKRAQKKAAAKPVPTATGTKTTRRSKTRTDTPSRLQIIENLKLGGKNQLVLVEADGQTFLLSVAGDKVTYLTDVGQMTTN